MILFSSLYGEPLEYYLSYYSQSIITKFIITILYSGLFRAKEI